MIFVVLWRYNRGNSAVTDIASGVKVIINGQWEKLDFVFACRQCRIN